MTYDGKMIEGSDRSYPAIIDTGTSQMTIPPREFAKVLEQWNLVMKKPLDCKSDDAFCTTDESCADVANIVKPVGIQMSGYVFELQP